MKHQLHYAFLLVLLLFFSCSREPEKRNTRPPVTVDVLIARQTDFPTTIEVNGSVLPEESIELHPEISGIITYLDIPDGARVSKGALLARINDSELQAQLAQQKVQLDLAEKTEGRLKKLLAVNGVNQSEYDAALSQVNLLQSNINLLNAQIDKTYIIAPFSGSLGLRMVSPGAYVSPQTVIGTLRQTDRTKIDFTIPQTYMSFIKVGGEVWVMENDSYQKLPAVITAVDPAINTDTRNIRVRARLAKGNAHAGSFVKVYLEKTSQGILVPSNAIIPDASSNQVVLVKNNKAVFTPVETGIRNEEMVEILGGLAQGDTIVVSGVLFVRPNSMVAVRNVKSIADGRILESK